MLDENSCALSKDLRGKLEVKDGVWLEIEGFHGIIKRRIDDFCPTGNTCDVYTLKNEGLTNLHGRIRIAKWFLTYVSKIIIIFKIIITLKIMICYDYFNSKSYVITINLDYLFLYEDSIVFSFSKLILRYQAA